MKFIIEQTVINQFPNTVIGILVANNVNNQADSSSISNIARAEEKRIRSQFDIETLTQNEGILVWREAYKKFGAEGGANYISLRIWGKNHEEAFGIVNKMQKQSGKKRVAEIVPIGREGGKIRKAA